MKILSIETSGKLCGACISDNENIIEKFELNNGLTHSESLMPLVQNLLEKNSYKVSDFDAFVCDIGPGSFTGIRIGVATIKAFVDAIPNKLCTGISSLEALAYNVKNAGLICSIIDCKNDNCYFSIYNLEKGKYTELQVPTASSIQELFDYLKQYANKKITFVGDGAIIYKNKIIENVSNSIFLDDEANIIDTGNLAIAGYNKLKENNILSLSPLYLKKPQAQRLLEEKEKLKIN